jgi:hypothetical protein
MKIRNGFVSNSSSSSFVLLLKDITPSQLDMLQRHTQIAQAAGWAFGEYPGDNEVCCCGWAGTKDAWEITVTDKSVKGYTVQDNFNMRAFMGRIGIASDLAKWSDS